MRLTKDTTGRQAIRVKDVHPLSWLAAIAAATLLAASAVGCGGSSSTTDGGFTGAGGKTDGAATGSGGRGGSSSTGTGGTSVSLLNVGKACAADTDCGSGLTCLTAASKIIVGQEGPANGYCSKSCAVDSDCGASGLCLDVSATTTPMGYCFETCSFGLAGTKCHSRTDVGCLTLDATTTPTTDVCYPVCSQDADCPTGRKCNLADGLCSDTASTGDPLGTHCTASADASTTTCAGGCLPISSGADAGAPVASFCTMLCVVGNLDACNWAGAGMSLATGGAHGVCGIAASTAQVGDIGFCTQECDAVADCTDKTDPGVSCDTSLMSTIGHGLCTWGG